MLQLPITSCARPVCEQPCMRKCPYEESAERDRFLRKWKRGKAVGPLERFQGYWMETVMAHNPWGNDG